MAITLPAFAQYQDSLFPLRGLWNIAPGEGDRFVNGTISWGTPGLQGTSCVQFQLSGNSPVAFSQIVAMSVDNSRCGSDVDFVFPDSGFVLTVPAHNQGVYPVFTNALMFYANCPTAALGDTTILQVLNSMPPPVGIQPSTEQQRLGANGVSLTTNSTTPIYAAAPTVNGTLYGFTLIFSGITAAATGQSTVSIQDGQPALLWTGVISAPQPSPVNMSGLDLRFKNGLNLVVSGATLSAGNVTVNVYFSVP
jgi:hypothetical protein